MPSLSPRRSPLAVAALVGQLALYASPAAAYSTDPTAADYKRPVAGYIPTIGPAVVFLLIFAVLATISWIHYARRRALVWLPIGHTAMAVGFAVRIVGHVRPYSIPIYSVSQICILLSPCAYLATCYQLLGRMANSLGPDTVAANCLLLRTSLITKLFVTSDIVTFLIQAGGSGLQATGGSTSTIGHNVAMAGLCIQLASFGTYFLVLLSTFALRVRKMYPELWHRSDGTFSWSPKQVFGRVDVDDWKVVFWTNVWACTGLFIRCVFRVVEYSQGYDGAIATNEAYIYCLDSLPLFLGLGAFCYFYPPRFLPHTVPEAGRPHVELGQRSPGQSADEMKGPLPSYR